MQSLNETYNIIIPIIAIIVAAIWVVGIRKDTRDSMKALRKHEAEKHKKSVDSKYTEAV